MIVGSAHDTVTPFGEPSRGGEDSWEVEYHRHSMLLVPDKADEVEMWLLVCAFHVRRAPSDGVFLIRWVGIT